jgi:excisionase family DNA binding protein
MDNILQIQTLTKQEFKSIIEEVIERQLTSLKESDQPENLTVKQVSIKLNLSKQSIWNKIKNGTIPAKKIGRKYIINSLELDGILKEVKSLKYRRDA